MPRRTDPKGNHGPLGRRSTLRWDDSGPDPPPSMGAGTNAPESGGIPSDWLQMSHFLVQVISPAGA